MVKALGPHAPAPSLRGPSTPAAGDVQGGPVCGPPSRGTAGQRACSSLQMGPQGFPAATLTLQTGLRLTKLTTQAAGRLGCRAARGHRLAASERAETRSPWAGRLGPSGRCLDIRVLMLPGHLDAQLELGPSEGSKPTLASAGGTSLVTYPAWKGAAAGFP